MRRSLLVLILVLVPTVRADNWPGWRGPTGQGLSIEKNLPVKWSATENLRWKVPLPGAGASSPVVWEDRIFVTASDGRLNDRLHVLCFARADGKLLWHIKLFGTAPTDLYPPGGMAVPTPATDGKCLFVLFGTGDLAALDLEGQPVWIRSLAQDYGPFRNRWGMASSPVLANDVLLVQVDHWSQSYLLAVETGSGKTRWKADRAAHVNWASPLVVRVKERTEVICLGTEKVTAHDLRNGDLLWWVEGLHYQCIPCPVVDGSTLVATSGVSSLGIRLDGTATGDLTRSHVLWTNKKGNAFVPSPLLYEGRLYVPGDKGVVTCLDVKTGEQVWRERLGSQYHASPVAGDGKVYLTSVEGVVHVLASGPEFRLLAANDLGETIVASPAISRRQIFLRGQKHLYCVGK